MKIYEPNSIAIRVPEVKMSFVYFLLRDGEVIYIGQTKKWLSRPFSHINKPFDEVRILECEPEDLDALEMQMIAKYKPTFNVGIKYVNTTSVNSVKKALLEQIASGDISWDSICKLLGRRIFQINVSQVRRMFLLTGSEVHTHGSSVYVDRADAERLLERLRHGA